MEKELLDALVRLNDFIDWDMINRKHEEHQLQTYIRSVIEKAQSN